MSEDDGIVSFATSEDNGTASFSEFRDSFCGGDVAVGSAEEAFCRVSEEVSTARDALDVFFPFFAGSLVFFMQAGFAMLCAGSVRQRSVKNILLNNIISIGGSALGFFLTGHTIANGWLPVPGFMSTSAEGFIENSNESADAGGFIGNSGFFLGDITTASREYAGWFFQFAFAATAATIVAGTVAERCKMTAYLCYSLMLTGFVYPVVVYSIWSSSGFLSAFNNNPAFGVGMIDFAGSGVVHMTGGATALAAAIVLGPRTGRFRDQWGNALSEPLSFPPHSVSLQVLGTFILWFGWYGFNPGSALASPTISSGAVAALCAVTTTLAAASGAVSAMFTDMIVSQQSADLTMAMNGALGGLVAITAGTAVVTPWAAIIIGIVAGWTHVLWSKLLVKLKIDDAVDAVPVHFANGMWGVIAVGLFASPTLISEAGFISPSHGWFYGGDLLFSQLLGILFINGWVAIVMTPYFHLLNILGLLRVDSEEEEEIQDIHNKEAETANLVLYSHAPAGR